MKISKIKHNIFRQAFYNCDNSHPLLIYNSWTQSSYQKQMHYTHTHPRDKPNNCHNHTKTGQKTWLIFTISRKEITCVE